MLKFHIHSCPSTHNMFNMQLTMQAHTQAWIPVGGAITAAIQDNTNRIFHKTLW